MTGDLDSERVVLSSALSFNGSAKRIWRVRGRQTGVVLGGLTAIAVVLIAFAWAFILTWYLFAFTIFFLPTVFWRHHRRGVRKDRAEKLRHREMLSGVDGRGPLETSLETSAQVAGVSRRSLAQGEHSTESLNP